MHHSDDKASYKGLHHEAKSTAALAGQLASPPIFFGIQKRPYATRCLRVQFVGSVRKRRGPEDRMEPLVTANFLQSYLGICRITERVSIVEKQNNVPALLLLILRRIL
jgi:hypothetical protein